MKDGPGPRYTAAGNSGWRAIVRLVVLDVAILETPILSSAVA